ncbi:MAG: histidine kinase dimerization/phospho-acceptor domain-containing protein [Bdellovibrionota bacterium]
MANKKGRDGGGKEQEQFRSNLLSIVSHELNTPLTGIINAISILEERYPKEAEFIPMIRRNAERLRKTVENLLEISRVDAGTLRVRLSEFDLRNFLFVRKPILQTQLEAVGFKVHFEAEDDLPHVCGDIRRLAHVFDSLVLNAAKFSNSGHLKQGEQGVINVTLKLDAVSELPPGVLSTRDKKTGMYLVVTVQSSLPSIGESPDTFEQLFEPFSPWRDADTRVREGLGVELAIAKEILLAHEGFIWADKGDEAGKGWRFHFALPLLSRLDELDLVINNRLSTSIGALAKLSLLLLRPEPGSSAGMDEQLEIFQILQKALFRSSDSAFWIQDTGEYVILMDDCDLEGGERVASRLLGTLRAAMPNLNFLWALTSGPEGGASAADLLENARASWRSGS